MNAHPITAEFSWELDEDGHLLIRFTNDDGCESTALIDDPQVMHRIGMLCLEHGRGDPYRNTWPSNEQATVEVASANTGPVAVVGRCDDDALFIRFLRTDGTTSQLAVPDRQGMRNVAHVFLVSADLATGAGVHAPASSHSSVLFVGRYNSLSEHSV